MIFNFFSKSLIGKFIKLFLVFCAVFLLFGFVMLYFIKIESEEYSVSFQNYKVREEAERIDDFILKTLDDLKSFYVLKDDIAKNDFSLTITHIYQLFLVNKSVEEIKIVSPGGLEILGVSRVGLIPKERLRSAKEEAYFKATKSGNIYMSDVQLEGQNVYADIAIPYLDNFRLTAVVEAKINFKYFFDGIVSSEDASGGGHMHILEASGIILAAPDDRYVGKDVSGTDLFKKTKEAKEGAVGIKCKPCIEEHEFNIIASSHKTKGQPYFIVALENSEDNVFELYYKIRNVFGSVAGLLLIFCIVAFWIFNFRMKKRIKILIDGIDRFHEGKYDEKIVLKTGDELEYIADHLNHFVSKIEEEIEEKNKVIEKLSEVGVMKYNFITIISHQLRTPVSSIMWLTETLSSQIGGALTQEQRAIFQDIYKATQNISQIINDMILMADIDENKVVLEKSVANCDDIISSAILAIQDEAREKKVEVVYQKSKIFLPDYKGDIKKLKLIFVRILDNAVKYSGPDKKVIIKVEVGDGELIFSVADNGIGIPQAEQSRIFIKFYRASNAYKLIQNASGLSLYIAKYFAELHGGKIWFDSKEGEGSTFYFSLPVK